MFWAVSELEWHFVGIQSQPKDWMASCVTFSVVGASQSCLCGAGSSDEGQSYSPSFLIGLVLFLSHPERPCKLKPGKKEAAKEEEQPPPSYPFCRLLILRPRSIQLLGEWAGMRVREDALRVSRRRGPRSPEELGVTGSAWASAAMPINRYLSGFISVERLLLLSSARARGAGSWVNSTLFSRKFHATGACSEEFDLNEN